MHLSLKGSMDRQPLTDRLGDRLLAEYGGAAAAYSLRALNGNGDSVVRVRRASDNDEKDFTAEQIELGEMVNWVNSQTVPPLDIGVETSEGRIPVPEGGTSIGTPAAAYSLRNLSTTYTGNVVDVRRSSDNAEESFTAEEVSDGTLEAWVDTEYTFYTSDFSADLDGWVPSSSILTPNIDQNADGSGQPPSDNWLRISASDRLSIANNRISVENIIKALGGGTYEVEVDYYAPETVSNHKVLALTDSAGNVSSAGVIFHQGSGSRTYSLVLSEVAATSLNSFRIGSTNTYPTGTLLYLKNIRIRKVDADGFVTKWYDQSGNDNHATQGTAAKQPKIVDGGSLVSGGNKFDGTNDFLTFPDRFLSGSFAISTVFNLQDRDKTNNTLFGYSNNTGFIRYQQNRLGIKLSGGENFINITLANNTDYVMSITRDASNLVSLYVDGSFIGSFTQSGQFSLDRIGVFAESSSYFLQGTMTETLIYASDQSANRTAIEANIGETYGITGIPAYDNTVDGFVETWYDQSGNGNDATQSVATAQPKIVDAGVLVSGGLDFDGVDDVLGTSLVPPNVATLIGVANWDVEDQTLMIIGARDGVTQRSYIAQSSSGKSSLGVSTSLFADGDIVAGDDYLLFGVHSGSTRLLSTNGSVISDSLGSAPNNTIQGYSVGALNTAGTNDAFMDGTLAEVIVYNSDQSANRVAIETNINDHYNIY
jgi:hypothetical protein